MAIEAKVSFMNQLEMRLSTDVTADLMSRVMKAVSDALEGYEMLEMFQRQDGPDDMLEAYLNALKVQGRSPKTIDQYRYVIGRMMESLNVPTRKVTVYHLRDYLAKEKERGIKDGTLKGIRGCFSAYFGWLWRETLIDKNPCANLGVIKKAKKVLPTYSEIELERLNRCCTSIRNRAILHFLRSTGCRISEATGLNRDQVDLDRLECVVLGKGNKERKVYLDEVAGTMLAEYLSLRTDMDPALFIGKRGERLQPGGVRYMLKKLAQCANVDHVHPHKFRRTLATGLARHGMPIQEVSRILGHEKIDTTMSYVILNNDDIKASYRRFT